MRVLLKVTVHYYCGIWCRMVMLLSCYLPDSDTLAAESDVADAGDLARNAIQNLAIMSSGRSRGGFWPVILP